MGHTPYSILSAELFFFAEKALMFLQHTGTHHLLEKVGFHIHWKKLRSMVHFLKYDGTHRAVVLCCVFKSSSTWLNLTERPILA